MRHLSEDKERFAADCAGATMTVLNPPAFRCATEKDRDLVIGLDADHVLPRGHGFPERVRELRPAGADGIIDAGVMNAAVAAAVCDGGTIMPLQ